MSARYVGVWSPQDAGRAGSLDSAGNSLDPKADHRRGAWVLEFEKKTAVTKIITRATSSGCNKCSAALYVQCFNHRLADLPMVWVAGGGTYDGLQWLRRDAWGLVKVGPCQCTGECLAFEITTEPVEQPPEGPFCGVVMGTPMVYFDGVAGPKYALPDSFFSQQKHSNSGLAHADPMTGLPVEAGYVAVIDPSAETEPDVSRPQRTKRMATTTAARPSRPRLFETRTKTVERRTCRAAGARTPCVAPGIICRGPPGCLCVHAVFDR